MPFSRKVKNKIRARANGKCEWNGCENEGQEASHLYHGIDKPEYGQLLCTKHHYTYHRLHIGKASLIGLTEKNNWRALKSLNNRLNNHEQ